MKPSELIPFLVDSFQNRMQVLIYGDPGVGKSDVIDQAGMLAQANILTKHPSVEDPIDSKGMPASIDVGNGLKIAKFLPFEDIYQLLTATKLTVCHLEDFGQAPVAVQKAYMQLLLRRQVNGHKLSDHVVFTGTTNNVGTMSGVDGIIEPVKGRWDTIIPFHVDLNDWVNWAIDHNMPPWLIAYMRDVPQALHEFKATKDLKKTPCPRTWAAVGKWSNIRKNILEVWAGCVGSGRAAEAFKFWEGSVSMPDPDACLLDPHNAPLPEKPSLRYAMSLAIAYRANGKNLEQCLIYTGRIGKPFEVLTVQTAHRKEPKIAASTAFARWASDPVNRDIAL